MCQMHHPIREQALEEDDTSEDIHTDANESERQHTVIPLEEEEGSLQQDLWQGREEASSLVEVSFCKACPAAN